MLPNVILWKNNCTFLVTSIYTCIKIKIIQVAKTRILCQQQYLMMSKVILTQIIKSPTRITCSSTSLIDHILASFSSRISHEGVMNVGLSDHQLIYCTRKVTSVKTGSVHKKTNYVHLRITCLI